MGRPEGGCEAIARTGTLAGGELNTLCLPLGSVGYRRIEGIKKINIH
jgi:hypothetical protein